jgi:ribosomal protein S18 acetylase RimI-like enzyme
MGGDPMVKRILHSGFYYAAGFTEVARRPRYYADGTDAIVMTLRLS